MTTTDISKLAPYVRYLADHMNLADWKFDITFSDLPDSLATIQCVPNRQFAIISVGQGFFEADDHDRRHGLVHELVHLHLEPARKTISNIEPTVAQPMYQVLKGCHDDQIESAADRLASAIAKGLMTPAEWSRRKTGK